jgi:hypothetical protein
LCLTILKSHKMKAKNESKKFSLEKFEMAKLKNTKSISGGSAIGNDGPKITGTDPILKTLRTIG